MRFSLAANFDPELIPALANYPVHDIYGKLADDGISGGRPGYMAADPGWVKFGSYVQLLRQHNIAFNYLLNGACQGNHEWSRRWQKHFNELLQRLCKLGVSQVTVATPFLLQCIKQRFPQLTVRVSIFAQVDTVTRARFWEDLGADIITLESFSLNRDFPRLQALRAAVSCELQLICNHLCLPNCPLQPYHMNGFAHSSADSQQLFIDYCLLHCSRQRLADPALLLKSNWIRPEDLPLYQQLGFSSFKLLERGIASAELLRRVQAYSSSHYRGNLAELLLSHGFRQTPRLQRRWYQRYFCKPWQLRPWRLRLFRDLAKRQGMLHPLPEQPISIDNEKIPPEFLPEVARRCAGRGDACQKCRYCDSIAANAVCIDPCFRSEVMAKTDAMLKRLNSGELWHV